MGTRSCEAVQSASTPKRLSPGEGHVAPLRERADREGELLGIEDRRAVGPGRRRQRPVLARRDHRDCGGPALLRRDGVQQLADEAIGVGGDPDIDIGRAGLRDEAERRAGGWVGQSEAAAGQRLAPGAVDIERTVDRQDGRGRGGGMVRSGSRPGCHGVAHRLPSARSDGHDARWRLTVLDLAFWLNASSAPVFGDSGARCIISTRSGDPFAEGRQPRRLSRQALPLTDGVYTRA
jgi:hypothetical protein